MNDLKYKYDNKKINETKESIDFNLTLLEFSQLLDDAEISVNDIGPAGYHLARYNDTGDYSVGNCRFIHYLDNIRERKVSDKVRETSRNTLIKVNKRRYESGIGNPMKGRKHTDESKRLISVNNKSKLSSIEINTRLDDLNIIEKKHGYVTILAKKWNVSHTQVRRFINKFGNVV